jgi:hypothetical protein
MEADAYSTTLYVLGEEDGRNFISDKDGCEAVFVAACPIGSEALRLAGELCALGPRDALTPGAEEAAKWIARKLAEAGLEPEVDEFDDPGPDGGRRVFHNVMATVRGRGEHAKGAGGVLLLSHYDTKAGIGLGFVGANDGASSTALLLALAAKFAREPAARDVGFAFLDGEECRRAYGEHDGLHGSRRLARRLKGEGARFDAVILLDMVGDSDLCITLPRNGTARLQTMVLDAAKAMGLRDKVRLLPYDILDDHQPFLDAGFPAVDIIDFEYGSAPGLRDYWHTEQDTVDKLSAQSLQDVADIVVEMVRR